MTFKHTILIIFFISLNLIAQTITSYPYSEGWETDFGSWTQSTSDDVDWNRNSGSTPTANSGPSSANEGSYYIYFEGTTTANYSAILESPTFDFSGLTTPEITFDYHMYFNNYTDGTLNIDISTDNGSNWTNLWSRTGQQGTGWFNDELIDLSTYSGNSNIQFRIEFTRGNEYFGYYDCAIDDINVYDATPVPVELTSFTARLDDRTVALSWQTATEVNNYGFEVQRVHLLSKNQNFGKVNWETLGFVEGHGNSNSPKEYMFLDKTQLSGTFQYRLKQIDTDGSFEYSKIIEVEIELPIEYELFQNYPNPFNPSTTITYGLKKESHVQLTIYNILGQEVVTLVNQKQQAGNYSVNFNASGLVSGTYIYKIIAGDFVSVKRLLLLK